MISHAFYAKYQWLNCDSNNQIIAGAISSHYLPKISGSYSVALVENGCIDTSECFTVVGLDVNKLVESKTEVYPNPSYYFLNVAFSRPMVKSSIRIYNLQGQEQKYIKCDHNFLQISITDLPQGNYILQIEEENVIEHHLFTKL